MEPIKTTIGRHQAFALRPRGDRTTGPRENPGGASFPQNPLFALPDFDPAPQPTETEELKTPRIITRPTPKTCASHGRQPLAPNPWPTPPSPGGANCKNDPPFAPPEFDPSPQPTEIEELKTPRITTRHTRKFAPPAPRPPGPGP